MTQTTEQISNAPAEIIESQKPKFTRPAGGKKLTEILQQREHQQQEQERVMQNFVPPGKKSVQSATSVEPAQKPSHSKTVNYKGGNFMRIRNEVLESKL